MNLRLSPACVALCLFACEGEINIPKGVPQPTTDNPMPMGGAALVSKCVDPNLIAPSARLARLTHVQYGNIVRDVLQLTAATETFEQDSASGGFTNNAVALSPTDRLVRDWNRSAETLAEQLVNDAGKLAAIAPCTGSPTQACFNTFVDKTGLKLYRHPLTTSQKTKLQTAWTLAGPIYDTGSQYQKAVRMALEAMLQSPFFIYRSELSTTADSSGAIALSGYEIAERLAFALWSSSPDDALLTAAQNGALTTADQVAAQARRMLADPKARVIVRDFYEQWLGLSDYASLSKSATLYPNFNTAMGADMQEETRLFVQDITLDSPGGFKDLYTAPHTFMNGSLAKLYGVSTVTGTAFQRVDLDASKRGGLLTQVGFLASHAYPDIDSPIHRGAFVLKRLMCSDFHPPGGINVVLPAVSDTLKTTRERVEAHTAAASCQACHSAINPVGFGFGHFDAVGQWRDVDHGENVDVKGSLPGPEGMANITGSSHLPKTEFDGAKELEGQLADHQTARRCFSMMWLRYLNSRLDGAEDACEVEALDKKLQDPAYPLKDVLVELVSARAFTHRAPEVTP